MKKFSLTVLLALSSLAAPRSNASTDLYCESGEPTGSGSTLEVTVEGRIGRVRAQTFNIHARFYNFKTHRRTTRDYFKSKTLSPLDTSDVIIFALDKNFTLEIQPPNDETDFHIMTITPSQAARARGFEVEELSCNE